MASADYIRQLYQQYLGRDPWPDEVQHWASQPLGMGQLQQMFYDSPEAQQYRARGVPAGAEQQPQQQQQAATPAGPQGGNYQGWFNSLVAGKPFNQQTILDLEPILNQYGVQLTPPNSQGERTKIGIPNGQGGYDWVRVGFGEGHPVWIPQGGDTPAQGEYNAPFTEQFSYADFAPPDAFSRPEWQAPTTVGDFNDPGYTARMKAGEEALQRSAAAKGTLLTGGTLKDISDWASDYASQEYQGAYNRAYQDYTTNYQKAWDEYKTNYQNKFNEWSAGYGKALGEYQQRYNIYDANQRNQYDRMYQLAQLGLSAAGQQAGYGTGYASIYGNALGNLGSAGAGLITGAGNAGAAGQVGSANAWNTALGNVGNLAGLYGSMYALGMGRGPVSTPPYSNPNGWFA
jgi:hypothetical protein